MKRLINIWLIFFTVNTGMHICKAFTINCICLVRQLNTIYGGGPWDLGNDKRYDYKISSDVSAYKKARNQKNYITFLVCNLHTKSPKILFFGYTTSRHANSTKCCSIIDIVDKNESWKFHINISKVLFFITICKMPQKVKYRTAYKMRARSHDFTNFTGSSV